jgi:hypothetical protein
MAAVVENRRGGYGADVRPYLSLAQAAAFSGFTVGRIKNLMRNGTLVEHVHFTRPRNSRPLIVLAAFDAYLRGEDEPLIAAHRKQQRRAPGRCNLGALKEAV